MIPFNPDICLPKDAPGFGQWLTGHYYEHQLFHKKCVALSPPKIIPEYDIFSWRDEPELVQQWLVSHNLMHQALGQTAGYTSQDFSLVDFSKDDEFLEWMDNHRQDHANLRAFFGII